MYLIQILLPFFFLIAAIKAVQRYRKNEITLGMMMGWIVLWIMGGAVVLNPNSTFYLARLLGVGRGADAVVYLALVVLFFMVFRLLVAVERLEKEVTVLTRALSLKEDGPDRDK